MSIRRRKRWKLSTLNGAVVEGLADRDGNRWKVVGEGESVSWGGARTKVKGRECELTKICSCTVIY